MGSLAERTDKLLGLALRFGLCASAAWLCALAFELFDMDGAWDNTPARLGYLSALAITCSLLWLPALVLCHALRWFLARRVRYANVLLCALLAAVIAVPSLRCAQLLTGGTGMLGSASELPLSVAFTVALIAGYVGVWLVHLKLCAEPAQSSLATRSPRVRRWLSAAALAVSIAVVWGFAYAANEQLRAYNFLVSFVMPAVWLAGASLLYGGMIRSPERQTWNVLMVAFVFGSAAHGVTHRTPALRAKAELIRRGGLVTLSEAASQFAPRPRFANLALSPASTARFDCVEPPTDVRPSALVTATEQRRNVILISIDALRKDALGRAPDGRDRTPALDAFAARSLVFERAITPYPATLFALGAVLTGAYPSEILLAPATLPDALQLTAASWDERIAIWPDVVWFRRAALPRLITRNLDPILLPGAERQTDQLISELRTARKAQRRTFAWIHYYEPHMNQLRALREQGGTARSRYEALVRVVDRQIGRLTAELERLGYFDDSLIVVFGDHGEALGELGYYGHHVYLNQFIGDIPLMVHAPGLEAGTSERLASLIDIAPTLLEWTGTPATALHGDARSLFEVARGESERYSLSEAFPVRGKLLFELVREPIASRAALGERLSLVQSGSADYQPKVALVSSRERLIVNRVTGDEEFYDRVADPREQRELSERGLASHARMRATLKRAVRRMSERIYCRVAALAAPARP
jgi:arylsulfatase A-like enzyme